MHTRWLVAAVSGALVLAMAFWYADHRGGAAAVSAAETTEAGGRSGHRSTTTVEASYVGNTNTYKFHRMSCRYATCKNCTAKFVSREEAIAAGFRPGGCCDP